MGRFDASDSGSDDGSEEEDQVSFEDYRKQLLRAASHEDADMPSPDPLVKENAAATRVQAAQPRPESST